MTRSSRHKSDKHHKHSVKEVVDSNVDGKKSSRERLEAVSAGYKSELRRNGVEESVGSKGVRVGKVKSEEDEEVKKKSEPVSHVGSRFFAPGNDEFLLEDRMVMDIEKDKMERWNEGAGKRENGIFEGISVMDYQGGSLKELKAVDTGETDEIVDVKKETGGWSKSGRRMHNLDDAGRENGYVVKGKNLPVSIDSEEKKGILVGMDKRKRQEKERDLEELKGSKQKGHGLERDKIEKNVKHESLEGHRDAVASATVTIIEEKRKQEIQMDGSRERQVLKREEVITERSLHDELRNPKLEKELEKRIRRRRRKDSSGDKEKWRAEAGDGDDGHFSVQDDRFKKERPRNESRREERDTVKPREYPESGHRHNGDKQREKYLSRGLHVSGHDDSHYKREIRPVESCHKRNASHGSQRDSSHTDNGDAKSKDHCGKNRYSNDYGSRNRSMSRDGKDFPVDVEEKSLRNSEPDNASHKGVSGCVYLDSDVFDVMSNNSQLTKTPGGGTLVAGEDRCKKNRYEVPSRESSRSKENPDDSTSSVGVDTYQSGEGKTQQKDQLCTKNSPISPCESQAPVLQSPCTGSPGSSNQPSSGKSSPATCDHLSSSCKRIRRSLDLEETGWRHSDSRDSGKEMMGSRIGSSDDRIGDSGMEKLVTAELPRAHLDQAGVSSIGPVKGSIWDESRLGRTLDGPTRTRTRTPVAPNVPTLFGQNSSPFPLPPTFRPSPSIPSAMGSLSGFSEEDSRNQDWKTNKHYRRGDIGGGNAWKGVPNWIFHGQGPLANSGFVPFQHQIGHPGVFPTVMQQFPVPSLFGIRPAFELNHRALSYHMQDGDGFPGFGWQAPPDDSCPPFLLQGQMDLRERPVSFGDEPNNHVRHNWDRNQIANGNHGSETGLQNRKGQYESQEKLNLGRFAGESMEIKQSKHASKKQTVDIPHVTLRPKLTESSKIASSKAHFYLSKLDISTELAGMELYEECEGLLGSGYKRSDHSVKSEKLPLQTPTTIDLEVIDKVSPKNYVHVRKQSPFPKTTDVIFQRAMVLYTKQTEGTKLKVADISGCGSDQEKAGQEENNQNQNGLSKEILENHNWDGLVEMEENNSELSEAVANAAILDESSRTPFLGSANISSSLVDEFGKGEVVLQPVGVQESDSDSNWPIRVGEEDEAAAAATKDGDVCNSYVEHVSETSVDSTVECKVNLSRIPQNTH